MVAYGTLKNQDTANVVQSNDKKGKIIHFEITFSVNEINMVTLN